MSALSRLFRHDRAVYGWALYDWANSAFATTVMAGFFPIFFKSYWSAGVDANTSTFWLGMGNSLAGLLVALVAPFLGAIADQGGARKRFLLFFAYTGVLMTAALFFIAKGAWGLAVVVYVIGTVGFSGANIFYDALLPLVAPKDKVDYISGFGFALGYLGGGVLFLINVLMTLFPAAFGLPDAATAVRWAFLTVALWWGGFTVFTIFWVKETLPERKTVSGWRAVGRGWRELKGTIAKFRHLRTLFTFLLAYWLYIDGVDTIIRMAVDYGLALGFEDTDLITALLLVQFIGFPAAIIYAKLGERWGVRKALFLGIFWYAGITVFGMTMTSRIEFYLLAAAVGMVQGGLQALSRSYFARFVPDGAAGEFFGFYNMIGKSAVVIGPILMGAVGLAARQILGDPSMSPEELAAVSQTATRIGIGAILILFLGGALLLYRVDEARGIREAAEFDHGR